MDDVRACGDLERQRQRAAAGACGRRSCFIDGVPKFHPGLKMRSAADVRFFIRRGPIAASVRPCARADFSASSPQHGFDQPGFRRVAIPQAAVLRRVGGLCAAVLCGDEREQARHHVAREPGGTRRAAASALNAMAPRGFSTVTRLIARANPGRRRIELHTRAACSRKREHRPARWLEAARVVRVVTPAAIGIAPGDEALAELLNRARPIRCGPERRG